MSSLCPWICSSTGSVVWVMLKISLPFKALVWIGLAKGSAQSPSLAAKCESIRLLSAPESMSAFRSVETAWCVTLTGVSGHEGSIEIVPSLRSFSRADGDKVTGFPRN